MSSDLASAVSPSGSERGSVLQRNDASNPVAPKVKPSLRGISHMLASVLALLGGGILYHLACTDRSVQASVVYSSSLFLLFGASALYHVPMWQPLARSRLKRLDHASIFVLIAGTYTPICMLALPPTTSGRLLTLVWSGAAAGILQSLFWVHAPRPLAVGLYLLLGWALLPFAGEVYSEIGQQGAALMLLGGLAYTIGAVFYAMRWPNLWPSVFGYHELFHLLVIVAACFHFAEVALLVARDSAGTDTA